MRIDPRTKYSRSLIILLFFILSGNLSAQKAEENKQIAQYNQEVRQMISFLEYSMNVLGNPAFTAKEKDVVINESYSKIFVNEKVQVEDDLAEKRDVVTNKDVQAYLKDIDFFFKEVEFKFNILDIGHYNNPDGGLFFIVKMMRSMKGMTVENVAINSDQERYVEINVDEENKDLKIASMYTTKLSRNEELAFWWAGLSYEWKTVLGVAIPVKEGLRLNDIEEFSDSTYVVGGEQFTDSISIIDLVKKAAARKELNLSGVTIIQDLRPLDQLKELRVLDISSSAISDLFPIRNITSLTYLNASNTNVEDLNPLRYSKSLKQLYINNTPVSSIRVIESFDNLEVLHLEQTVIDSLPSMAALTYLKEFNCSSTNLLRLDSLKYLTELEALYFSNTSVNDLRPISTLGKLKKLDLSKTNVESLEGIQSVASLEELNIEDTDIDNLAPLEKLEHVQVIYADRAKIDMEDFVSFAQLSPRTDIIFMTDTLNDFLNRLDQGWKTYLQNECKFGEKVSKRDLHAILKIHELDLRGENLIDLSALKYMPLLESLNFSGTGIADLSPMTNLTKLRMINGAGSAVTDLSPLKNKSSLRVVNFESTGISDISALSSMAEADSLIFNKTLVKNISALNKLKSFRIAYFDKTSVTDEDVAQIDFDENNSIVIYKSDRLAPWWGNMDDKWQDIFIARNGLSKPPTTEELHKLVAAKSIEVTGTSLRNLDPIPEFIRLESLAFTETRISSLNSLSGLKKLKVLRFPRNPISEIDPISNISSLVVLDMNNTQVDNLKPLSGLVELKELTFSGTNVKDLSPIEDLKNLEVLDFSKTKIKQIKSLDELPNLKTVNCYNNNISDKKIEEFRINNPDCEIVFY
jgi:Leucine-rich repeat (LRR) protein